MIPNTGDIRGSAYELLFNATQLLIEKVDGVGTDSLLEEAGRLLENYARLNPPDRTKELYTAALSYYLAGHYARAYVLIKETDSYLDPAQPFSMLKLLFMKNLDELRASILILADQLENYADGPLASRLRNGELNESEAIENILQATLNRSIGLFLQYVINGHEELVEKAIQLLEIGSQLALDQLVQDYWWILRVTELIIKEYHQNSLWVRLRPMLEQDTSGLVREYIQASEQCKKPVIELWRSQTVAIGPINENGRPSFCIKMPTSSGKTRIAELAILRFLLDSTTDRERKCIYIAPFRALAAEIEADLGESLGPLGVRVSELYGGFDVNPAEQALWEKTRILIATPEKIDAFLRYDQELAKNIGLIIIDEGHIIGSGERGLRYELFLQRLVRRFGDRGIRLLFISAVMPGVDQFTIWITGKDKSEGLITCEWRPTNLFTGILEWDGQIGNKVYTHRNLEPIKLPSHRFVDAFPADELKVCKAPRRVFPYKGNKSEIIAIAGIEAAREGAALIFVPQPEWVRSVAEAVMFALKLEEQLAKHRGTRPRGLPKPSAPEDMARWRACIRLAEETTGDESIVVRSLKAGFIIHHGDIPKSLRAELERLARDRILNLVIATNTLAQGVNLPVRTVLIHSLVQGKERPVPATDFWNICGRAGRALRENEGEALLLADETSDINATRQARQALANYVRQAQLQTLASALRVFLEKVLTAWSKAYPSASLSELCQHLADNEIDWLSVENQHLLSVLDTQLLALVDELAQTGSAPQLVQNIFERSLLLLQLQQPALGRRLNPSTAMEILAARVANLQRFPDSTRKRFYRTGLALVDCKYLEQHRVEIEAKLSLAKDYLEWDPENRCEYIVSICRDILFSLSDVKPAKAEELPSCWTQILNRWLMGETAEKIAKFPGIAAEVKGTMEVSRVIDEMCDYRLPWGMNALFTFLTADVGTSGSQGAQSAGDLPEVLPYLPTMIRFGLHSPIATILMSTGLRSRSVASVCAERYKGPLDMSVLFTWLYSLNKTEIRQWKVGQEAEETVFKFLTRFQQDEEFKLQSDNLAFYVLQVTNKEFISPLLPGMSLVARPVPSDRFMLYTPAIEQLAIVQIDNTELYARLLAHQATVTIDKVEVMGTDSLRIHISIQ